MSESTKGLIAATLQAAAESIRALRRRRIHPHFAGYLCVLRAAAAADSTREIKVNFKQFFDEFLAYGNAPEKRPYVVSFSGGRGTNSIFFNKNVAGSYAPSSLRPGHAFTQVVSVTGSKTDARYTLPSGHAPAALRHLLYGQKLPIVPLSVFLYRDYGLREDTSTADFQAFVSEFRSEFGFAALGGTAVFGELFETDSSYLQDVEVTQRISAGMARTPKPIRRLTAAELGIETAETDSAGDEREIASPEARTARRIPEQADAPIITGITDHRLIKISGRPIRQTASGAEVSKYLESRFKRVISDIEGQATKIVVDDFRQGEELLHDWSISKLLAFGTHLYLLGGHVNDLKQEFLEDKARRLDALMHSAREFMNSFKEWHEYVEQSTLLDVEVGEGAKEIISAAKDAAKGLAREKESVDPEISSALTECANTANRKGSKQGVVVNVMSALRSITNISISFIEYVTKVAKDSYVAMTENDRVRKLLGFIRDFFPTTLRLATIYTSHSWMLAFSDLIRAACERRRKSVQAM